MARASSPVSRLIDGSANDKDDTPWRGAFPKMVPARRRELNVIAAAHFWSAVGRLGHNDSVVIVSRRNSPPSEVHAQRRATGGARREATERVTLRGPAFETHGWTLNVSRGGMRAIVEEPVQAGSEYVLLVGDADETGRKVSVVWVQNEADGQIVGLRFLDVEGSVPPETGALEI